MRGWEEDLRMCKFGDVRMKENVGSHSPESGYISYLSLHARWNLPQSPNGAKYSSEGIYPFVSGEFPPPSPEGTAYISGRHPSA
jgi:hypothetical protein